MCCMGQSEGNCFKHWNTFRSSVGFDCPNRSLMVRTTDGHNQNKNLTMFHSKNRTKDVCCMGQENGHSN